MADLRGAGHSLGSVITQVPSCLVLMLSPRCRVSFACAVSRVFSYISTGVLLSRFLRSRAFLGEWVALVKGELKAFLCLCLGALRDCCYFSVPTEHARWRRVVYAVCAGRGFKGNFWSQSSSQGSGLFWVWQVFTLHLDHFIWFVDIKWS